MAINKDNLTTVVNLCDWDIHFKLQNTVGDAIIKGNGTKEMFVSEISSQVNNGNPFFVGTDGRGSHAKVYIKDDELRKELQFDNEEGKQIVLDNEKCKYILELKTDKSFEDNVEKYVSENHEKQRIMNMARKLKINDYNRISFLEKITELKFKE
jgi:hypothetical protein